MLLIVYLILCLPASQESYESQAQFYPVQATTQLVPPYSVYLSDYATPGEEKLRVILVQRDITQPAYQLRLMLMVEWEGQVIMRTSPAFNPRPITLDPGVPTIISGADLASYLDSRNLDFTGFSREQYERTKALPEGSYRICFVAYDYRRQDRQVSNDGCSFYYLSKNEPPITNIPVCGTRAQVRTPQLVTFSWLPRNTASANSAGNTHYEFALYETRPAGRNPNDVVLTTQPVFRTTTEVTQLVYGPAEPMLIEGLTYVWRVRAIDKNGRDAFRNNGYSEVCTFRYGGFDPLFDIGVVKNLQAEAQTDRRGRVWWDEGEYEGYRTYYRKTGNNDYEWFFSDTKNTEIKIYDLEPDTEYEARVQARKNNAFGPYSQTMKFRTLPLNIVECGQTPPPITTPPGAPLAFTTPFMVIKTRGMDMTLVEVEPLADAGYYKGIAFVNPRFFGGARFYVKFERLFIDENRVASDNGRIDFISEDVAKWTQDQIANHKIKIIKDTGNHNQEAWAGTDFHEKIFKYDEIAIDKIAVDASGNVVVTDVNGLTYTNTEIPAIMANAPTKAIIIEDKNGDQFVVQKDKTTGQTKVSKVQGGGLSPGMSVAVSDVTMDILKKALRSLRNDYSDSKIETLGRQLDDTERQWDTQLTSQDARYGFSSGQNSQISPGESAFFEFATKDTKPSVTSSLSRQYKDLEFEFNKAIIIKVIAQEGKAENIRKDMAIGLTYNGQNIAAYIDDQKKLNKTDNEIIPAVKSSIADFVGDKLKEYLVFKK